MTSEFMKNLRSTSIFQYRSYCFTSNFSSVLEHSQFNFNINLYFILSLIFKWTSAAIEIANNEVFTKVATFRIHIWSLLVLMNAVSCPFLRIDFDFWWQTLQFRCILDPRLLLTSKCRFQNSLIFIQKFGAMLNDMDLIYAVSENFPSIRSLETRTITS